MFVLKIDWQAEVLKLIAEYFKELGVDYHLPQNVYRSLVDFMNLDFKLVKSVPRTVFQSRELLSRTLSQDDKVGLDYIVAKIQRGEDINFHQSKMVFNPIHHDLLLNDWVIYHLHLSTNRSNSNQPFYNRTKNVLFTAFSPNQAFLIDIRAHGINGEKHVFAKQELLEIIDSNWPHMFRIDNRQEADFFAEERPPDKIEILRKKGYAVGTTIINGKIIINPGLAITTTGHNIQVVSRANEIYRYLYEASNEIEEKEADIKSVLSRKAGTKLKELKITLIRIDEWPFFVFLETQTNLVIQ